MTDPLIQRQGYDAEALAQAFDDMAARIRLNKDTNFGGAFVLVPPAGLGNPVDSLLLNSANAGMMFWTNLRDIAAQTIKQAEENARLQGRF